MAFANLIRFKDEKGIIRYGDVRADQLGSLINANVAILDGNPLQGGVIPNGQMAVVHEVRSRSHENYVFTNIEYHIGSLSA